MKRDSWAIAFNPEDLIGMIITDIAIDCLHLATLGQMGLEFHYSRSR